MIEVFESSYTVFLTCIESKYEGNNKNPDSSNNTFPHVDQIPSITGTPSSKCSETQPRSQSSSAISDVMSPVKLVGKNSPGRLANNGKSKAKNTTSAKILE